MKTAEHTIQIENFTEWYAYLHKQHPEILGAEWDKEAKLLKIFYPDTTTELTQETLENFKIPTILRFRKKLTPPTIPNATAISENEFIVETFDVKTTREEVRKKYADFEEVAET